MALNCSENLFVPISFNRYKESTSEKGSISTANTKLLGCKNAISKNINLISSRLRKRLRYSLIKLENGWISNSLDQVENLYFNRHHSVNIKQIKNKIDLGKESNVTAKRTFRSLLNPIIPSTYESFWAIYPPFSLQHSKVCSLKEKTSSNIEIHKI
ncbi:uncharacterized protein T551_00856 [Pneumocystis jirovecii RU7]|uniref:Uncharacterized protein n=1 Tax=Pneumocystis jirovecii (strain RU7) TaxID=1408657 RepID=A0A0W4ZUW6_PNEJ7|nr:uncharacterized protein T551_00856 [Pneumocystis jirovecii RU7]KTW32174.1 hypothetical protein T551_00856 [Pneumocystis jirovecii RU7]